MSNIHRFSERRHVMYIDGPLKGQAMPVANGIYSVQACDPLDSSLIPEIFTYRITEVGFHHGGEKVVMLIATLDTVGYSAGDLADVMLSDYAKKARIT